MLFIMVLNDSLFITCLVPDTVTLMWIVMLLQLTAGLHYDTQPINIVKKKYYRLMKISSKWLKRRNPCPCDNILTETINKLSTKEMFVISDEKLNVY